MSTISESSVSAVQITYPHKIPMILKIIISILFLFLGTITYETYQAFKEEERKADVE